jgi:hypothetical protein
MHALKPRSASRLPRQAGRQGQGISNFLIVNQGIASRRTAHEWQFRQARVTQPETFRLKVSQANGGRRPAVKTQGGNARTSGLEQNFIGGHVMGAICHRVLD